MLPVTPIVTRFPERTRTWPMPSGTGLCLRARRVELVVESQTHQVQGGIVHVRDVSLGQDVVGQTAGGNDQRIFAELCLDASDQALDQADIAVHPAGTQGGDRVAADDLF